MENNNNLLAKLEVLLFMARDPLSIEELTKILACEVTVIEDTLQSLKIKYENSEEHGIKIINVAEGYQFATKPEYAKTLELYVNTPREVSLSTAALETLAIIAYRQPITRTEIEAIRGVNSDGIVKSLLDKELIEEQGKADTIGRPALYGTTAAFLKHFGLKNLEDLPDYPKQRMAENENVKEMLAGFNRVFIDSSTGTTTLEPYEIS